jgi:hypothetical protein
LVQVDSLVVAAALVVQVVAEDGIFMAARLVSFLLHQSRSQVLRAPLVPKQ